MMGRFGTSWKGTASWWPTMTRFWTWLLTRESSVFPTQAEIEARADKANDLGDRARKLCERLGVAGEMEGMTVPVEAAHLLSISILEQFEQRIEDLERKAGGREHLRSLRAWHKEKGDE